MRAKRALAILISLVLTVGMLSVSAFAADAAPEGASGEAAAAAEAPAAETPAEEEKDPCADGHDYAVTEEVEPTCTEDGRIVYTCTRCGDSYEEKGEKALGHDFSGEGVITKNPTEDEEGVMTWTCTRCGTETKTESIPKLEKPANLFIGFEEAGKDSGKIDAGKGRIEYKYKNKGEDKDEKVTLTLHKATLKADSKKGDTMPPAAAVAYTGTGTLVVELEDENHITGTSYAIYAPNATVEISGGEDDSLIAEAAPENSNAIHAKEIEIKGDLETTSPEDSYVFTGANNDGSSFKTIAYLSNGRNVAATTVKIEVPEEEEQVEQQAENADAEPEADADEKDADEQEQAQDADTSDEKNEDEQTADDKKTEDDQSVQDSGSGKTMITFEPGEEEEKEEAKNTGETGEVKNNEEKKDDGENENTEETGEDNNNEESKDNGENEDNKENGDSGEVQSFNLRIAGVEITAETDEEDSAWTGRIKAEKTGEGASEEIKLTLDGATVDSGSADTAISYEGEGTLVISLKGKNSLSGKTYGIYAPKGTIRFTGEEDADLTVTAAVATNPTFAVYAKEIEEVEEPLAVTDPADHEIFAGELDDDENNKTPYHTFAYEDEDGGKIAALSVIIKKPASFTVTFDSNGGSGTMEDVSATEGRKLELPECAFKAPTENEEFDQWEIDKETFDAGDKVVISEDTKVTAQWKDIEFTITYDPGEGNGEMEPEKVKKANGVLRLPACDFTAPPGSEFDKWKVGDGEYAVGKSAPIIDNTIVTAIWKTTQAQTELYTVKYDANGGSATMEDDSVEKGKDLTLPICTFTPPAGKVFDKWQVGDGEYIPGAKAPITKDNTIVKALWKDKSSRDEGKPDDGKKDDSGKDDGKKDDSGKEDVTPPAETCTVTFDPNGGSGTMEAMSVTKGSKLTLPACAFTAPEGKDFDQWQIDGSKHAANTAVDITADTTVKALWKDHVHVWGKPQVSVENGVATFTFTCTTNTEHKETKSAALEPDVSKLPTKNESGEMIYVAKVTFNGKEYKGTTRKITIEPAGTSGYKFTVNPGSWKKSNNTLSLTVKRTKYDDLTYSLFENGGTISVDGKKVSNKNNANYTTEKGSLKLTFKPAYLSSLTAGVHTLKIEFADGSVETKFSVSGTAAAAKTNTATKKANTTTTGTKTAANGKSNVTTGDSTNWAMWIGILAAAVVGIGAIVFAKKRGKKEEEKTEEKKEE